MDINPWLFPWPWLHFRSLNKYVSFYTFMNTCVCICVDSWKTFKRLWGQNATKKQETKFLIAGTRHFVSVGQKRCSMLKYRTGCTSYGCERNIGVKCEWKSESRRNTSACLSHLTIIFLFIFTQICIHLCYFLGVKIGSTSTFHRERQIWINGYVVPLFTVSYRYEFTLVFSVVFSTSWCLLLNLERAYFS